MTIHDWIKWAFAAADEPHRFASHILARQASRDLGVEITTADLEAAMAQAGYTVHHRNQYGAAYYLAADTKSKKLYDFRRFVLVEGIDHPLNTPDPCAAFNALPAEDQAAMLEWIKTSLVPIRRALLVSELRFPCQVVSGLAITNEHMRGALLTAGIETAGPRFRCCLSDNALHEFRRVRRTQLQEKQP